jgi:hypothetical protein
MVSCDGRAPVMAIVEQLTSAQCRLRSVNAFDIGASVAFAVVIHGADSVHLSGRVTAQRQSGPRFTYDVVLENAPAAEIARAVEVARARRGAASADAQSGSALTRASIRVPVDFEVQYLAEKSGLRTARATNLSTGGMLMNSTDDLAVGTSLEVRFMLGTTPVSVNGRIVAHQAATPNYNIAFYDIRPLVKETLARFVNSAS